MSGWGIKESKTASGTVAITTAGVVTGTGTSFTTQAAVGDFLRSGDQEFIIKSIASNTACTVINANPELTWTTINSGASYSLSEKPTSLASDPSLLSTNVYGVDTTEMGIAAMLKKGVAHAGWVAETTRGSRKTYETLVALSKNGASSANMGDAEDTVFPDSTTTTTTTTAAPTTTTTTTAAPTTTTTTTVGP